MSRRVLLMTVLGMLLLITAACTNKKSVNPLAGVNSKQPDKILFDKAMEAMRHNRFDVARLTLQTLINTYPNSEFIARAKLAVGDSWYAEGGTAALAQAEQEYSDFEIYFPTMPEAAEAQLKIANIHYQQMEKSDRDYTHAKRAEDEYRKMILQYPDSKLVPEAKQRLLEVQEVLGEREFEIGRFYYLRQSYLASEARLQTLINEYPLYSRADEALYLLGQNYEGQIDRVRRTPTCDAHGLPRGCIREGDKAKMEPYLQDLTKKATEAYAKILTRYPLMDRSDDAGKRLAAMHQPIPRPTKGDVARNKAEIESRGESNTVQGLMNLIKRGPDVANATRSGDPTLVDPEPVAARDLANKQAFAAMGLPEKGKNSMGVEILNPEPTAATPPNGTAPGGSPFASNFSATAPPAKPDPNELTPTAPADPNELKTTDSGGDPALPPPTQVNEIQQGHASSSATASADSSAPASDQEISSSKKKKKKGLKKLIPF